MNILKAGFQQGDGFHQGIELQQCEEVQQYDEFHQNDEFHRNDEFNKMLNSIKVMTFHQHNEFLLDKDWIFTS